MLMLGRNCLSYRSGLMQPAQLDLEKLSASNGGNLVTRLSGKLSLETVHNFIQTLRPEPPAQPWEVLCAGRANAAGHGGDAGRWPGEAAAELSYGRGSPRRKELAL